MAGKKKPELFIRNLYFAQMNLAGQSAMEPGGISRIANLTSKWIAEKGVPDQRRWEWYYLRPFGDGHQVRHRALRS